LDANFLHRPSANLFLRGGIQAMGFTIPTHRRDVGAGPAGKPRQLDPTYGYAGYFPRGYLGSRTRPVRSVLDARSDEPGLYSDGARQRAERTADTVYPRFQECGAATHYTNCT